MTLCDTWRRPLAGGPRRLIVLKQVEVPAGHEGRQRALEEVRLAAHLHHPNIARVLGLAEDEGTPCVVLEHVRGVFLGTLLSVGLMAGRKPSPAFAAFVAAEAAQALDYASHCEDDRGRPLHILHHAVSPMTLRLGHKGRVKLCDFGAAWSELLGRTPTPPRVLRGNLAYAAPELLHAAQRGPAGLLSSLAADARADVFSLGLVLLEMLAGHHPLDPPDVPPRRPSRAALRLVSGVRAEQSSWASLEVLADRLLHFGPEAVERAAPRAPARLKAILHRALRLEPAERYPSAAELRDDLRAYLRGLARPYSASELATEMATLLGHASALKRPQAHPVELGVLGGALSPWAWRQLHSTVSGHEVAPSAGPLEPAGGAAAPPGASPSAPQEGAPVKTPQQPVRSEPRKQSHVVKRVAKAVGMAAACQMLAGCPSPAVVVVTAPRGRRRARPVPRRPCSGCWG